MSNYESRSTEDLLRLRDNLAESIDRIEDDVACLKERLHNLRDALDENLEMYENVEAILLARTTSKEFNGNA